MRIYEVDFDSRDFFLGFVVLVGLVGFLGASQAEKQRRNDLI